MPKKIKLNRIAICQYQWPLQAQVVNMVYKLRELGFEVDIFLYKCREGGVVDLDQFAFDDKVTIHNFRVLSKREQSFFKKGFFYVGYKTGFKNDSKTIIDNSVLAKARKVFGKYKFVIGVEKKGLIWAGKLLRRDNDAFLIYYSLELYLEKQIFKNEISNFSKLRRLEKKFHRRCKATIIQDKSRAEVLFQYNKVQTDLICLPVSVKGTKKERWNNYFHRKFQLPHDVRIILYFGMLTQNRYCGELMKLSGKLDINEVMILHGYGYPKEIEELKGLETDKARLSMDIIPEDEIEELVSSCDVGIALYSNKSFNDRLTAFSSEKVALYARAGKPFIAFEHENFKDLRSEFSCCELITGIDEIPQAIDKIFNNYKAYKNNAFRAFEKYYAFDTVSSGLADYLKYN